MMRDFKNDFLLNAKNLVGWRTKRKIVVFAVDDYGNVRLHSKEAREKLDQAGLPAHNRFDKFDALETRTDLESLFKVLTSVKDKHGNSAVFTAYALPCNINFDKVAETGYEEYHYERLPQTFQKLSALDVTAYGGTWELWQEGIEKGLLVPQFHGREHLNLKVFNEKLLVKDHDLMTCLQNRSFTSITGNSYETISPMAALDFWSFEENDRLHWIIEDGLDQFEKVFGYRARNFTPPVYNAHPVLYKTLKREGITFIDTAMIANEHQGHGKYKRKFNYTGKEMAASLLSMVRNVVFEPTDDRGVDWVKYTLKQIEAAFRWNRPAIISSHRVNFCGHIDEKNREKGINALSELLKKITERWPDVEFIAANELGDLILETKK
ncbi:hypothetical protein CK503_10190 [Aliifodinibius salipaludis]|uniref:Polysaccharide (De)acetylase n=1 Tax=Fodinibius salipaludis TaxID=2032627 RepID=A0A2A2GAJ8_9BACT|nr:hypothetical protein [Aliifodinibius salipaludis]PAU94024.1 hypothetical protein CK503_10190 [Aliifodinibius salipaludis]